MKFRYSQISSWLKCKKQHQYAYIENLKPIQLQNRMALGTLVHAGMEGYFLGQDPVAFIEKSVGQFTQLPNVNHEEVEQLKQESIRIAKGTIKFLNNEWEALTVNGKKAVELEVETDLPDGNKVIGHIDLVARHKPSGQIFVIDFKTRGTLKPDEQEQYNLQLCMYQYILRKMNIDCIGSAIFQIRSEPLTEPKVNKDGTLSKAKVATTWEEYRKKIQELGLDEFDYADMKEKLKDIEFFRITKVFRSQKTVENIWEDVVIASCREILESKHSTRNLTPFGCGNCRYNVLCFSEIDGGDADYIKNTQFQNRNSELTAIAKLVEET